MVTAHPCDPRPGLKPIFGTQGILGSHSVSGVSHKPMLELDVAVGKVAPLRKDKSCPKVSWDSTNDFNIFYLGQVA